MTYRSGKRSGGCYHAGGNVEAGFGVAYARTLSRYKVTEIETGARGTIPPFAPLGLTTQVSFRF